MRITSDCTRIADMIIRALIIVFVMVLFFGIGKQACAEEPAYFEAWAVQSWQQARTFPDVTERIVDERGRLGAELFGRVPWGRFAFIGRLYSEGAAGAYSFRDPSLWDRGVAEGAVAYEVLRSGRYSLSVMGGYGWSMELHRGGQDFQVPDEANELGGPPPKYGAGLHVRDGKSGAWFNFRPLQRDEAVGKGWHVAGAIHIPVVRQRVAVGAVGAFGEYRTIQLQIKALLWRKGRK